VRLIIADTGPINYLVLIGSIDLLPILFENVILPSAVRAELTDPDAPPSVRNWIANPRFGFPYTRRRAVNSTIVLWKDSMKGKQPQSPWLLRSAPIYCSWMIARA
jgi:hypothetical protein